MPPPESGFVVVWTVVPFDAGHVLLPGLLMLGLCAALLLLRRRVKPGAGLLLAAAVFLGLGAAWWTLGGIGAWRAGVGRLENGTANFVEGPLSAEVRSPGGLLVAFDVAGQAFRQPRDAAFPAFHASRWPTVPLPSGQRVRVWFFEGDVLRLEVAEAR